MTIYACPYCGQSSYAKSSKRQGQYTSWNAVTRHVSTCSKVDYTYIITEEYGPLLISSILELTPKEISFKYYKADIYGKIRHLYKTSKIINMPTLAIRYSTQDIITSIQDFVKKYNKIPASRDFEGQSEYPSSRMVKDAFGSWNAAIEAAGFKPNIQNGFGINTYGLDGYLYRSQAEAYFADTYLFNRVKYEIEPSYPKPYNKWYDWYLPEYDTYIELDGECRPEVIQDKIHINKLLNRHCLFIKTKNIYNKSSILSF